MSSTSASHDSVQRSGVEKNKMTRPAPPLALQGFLMPLDGSAPLASASSTGDKVSYVASEDMDDTSSTYTIGRSPVRRIIPKVNSKKHPFSRLELEALQRWGKQNSWKEECTPASGERGEALSPSSQSTSSASPLWTPERCRTQSKQAGVSSGCSSNAYSAGTPATTPSAPSFSPTRRLNLKSPMQSPVCERRHQSMKPVNTFRSLLDFGSKSNGLPLDPDPFGIRNPIIARKLPVLSPAEIDRLRQKEDEELIAWWGVGGGASLERRERRPEL